MSAKEKIIDTFVQLLLSKNYSTITVSEIIKLSKIHRSTFYKYFKDKEDLLDYFLSENIKKNSYFPYE